MKQSSKPEQQYNLPSGKTSTSVKKYTSSWRKLRKACEEALGVRVIGYDPGLSFAGEGDLAVRHAIHLWEYINKREWKD